MYPQSSYYIYKFTLGRWSRKPAAFYFPKKKCINWMFLIWTYVVRCFASQPLSIRYDHQSLSRKRCFRFRSAVISANFHFNLGFDFQCGCSSGNQFGFEKKNSTFPLRITFECRTNFTRRIKWKKELNFTGTVWFDSKLELFCTWTDIDKWLKTATLQISA